MDKIKLSFEGYIPVLATCEIEIDKASELHKSIDIQSFANNKKIIENLNWRILLDEYNFNSNKYRLIYKNLNECSNDDLLNLIENIEVNVIDVNQEE